MHAHTFIDRVCGQIVEVDVAIYAVLLEQNENNIRDYHIVTHLYRVTDHVTYLCHTPVRTVHLK